MNPRYLLTSVAPLGADPVDVLLADGVIAAIGPDARAQAGDATEIHGAGLVLLPGLVDLHTHLREPGREDAETIRTGTRAAALGGFTAVHAMANTSPTQDTAGVVEQVWRLGREAGWVDVHPVGAVTVGLAGLQLAELGAMAQSQAEVRVFSDDGKCVHDPVLMRRALEYVKAFDGVVAQHAQEPRLTENAQMHEGVVSAELGLAGWPAVAEEAIIARDVLLAEHVGSRLHVCHLSTAGSVEIVRWAKSRGIDVTAEVTPHHLLLTDDLARGYDPVFKVNPPLRTEADVEAVRAGLADGTIDIVATDHAPHTREDKDCEWAAAAFGMTGLETALSVVQQTMVDTGRLTWADVARVLSTTPARIGRVTDHGRPIAVGEPANLVLVDPAARRTVDPAAQATKSVNSPYRGRELPGCVVATFLRGRATVLDGTPCDEDAR
ncbi:dihydroorotase [Cellulomonas fimi]|uniref:Dihydroorotase n=1 Tax=Cellulomonas fimi (strain ATCC 484 / DSM 20113 / JCM 1341 / CCUG 24087 / LMG 16345 / NBRC 15513 / NCIMB 8980 / NCTC 7547 / NRS-133) TaxID=590998 RepID=F4H063_CELFA|nr:dihydroorotase [Cellulomonas fimi]AEE46110.1 dihydroorotase, multifunctional complex type [Cellulomonas fimi ATCC 484]NNH08443.1 dihydroorotase [Cellulomonas fimi]VEH31671.1 Dihydroorotase [Cellulomonas fimi]